MVVMLLPGHLSMHCGCDPWPGTKVLSMLMYLDIQDVTRNCCEVPVAVDDWNHNCCALNAGN